MFGWLHKEPKHLIELRHVMAEKLADYPVYDPPHRQGPSYQRRQKNADEEKYIALFKEFHHRGEENFEFFLSQKAMRLTALNGFLAKFGVRAGLDDAGLAAVSAWIPGNGGTLVADLRDNTTLQIFTRRLQPWTGQWLGLNVIFDLGVFFGDSVINRATCLHWKYRGAATDGDSILSGYSIAGFAMKHGNWLDPMMEVYHCCGGDEVHLRTGKSIFRVSPDFLVGKVRDFSTR